MKRRFLWLFHRIYSDFFMPGRSGEYQKLVLTAKANGYQVLSVRKYLDVSNPNLGSSAQRVLIMRHDIDTDPAFARQFLSIERQLEISSSYYFRLSTLDIELMKEIDASGCEASYHYEEIATYAKKECLKAGPEVLLRMGEVQDTFRANLARLRRMTGLPMTTVASHGDFANRRLSMPNHVLLNDQKLRQELGIEHEVYDPPVGGKEIAHFTDAPYPEFWRPTSPLAAIEAKEPLIYVLTHPRHWRSQWVSNLKDDIQRLIEGYRYSRCR